jgi:poly(A) polymerase
MLLRCATGEQNSAIGEWWTDFIAADPAGQEALMAAAKTELGSSAGSPAKRRRRRKPKSDSSPEPEAA